MFIKLRRVSSIIIIKKYLLTIFLLFVLSLAGINVSGYEIAVVKSRNVKPYNMALDGFKSASGGKITEYVISTRKNNSDIIDRIRFRAPDIILAIGLEALLLAKEETAHIPIVYCMVMYPEKLNIDKHKGQITGITLKIPVSDQMFKLKSVIPDLKRVGMIYDAKNTVHLIKKARETAKSLGIKLVTEKVNSRKAVPKAIRKLMGNIDAFWLIADATVMTIDSFEFIHMATIENRIPLVTYSEGLVQSGALLSLSADHFYIGKQAARLADEIMNGSATSLPQIVDPDVKNFAININAAKKIGINIPAEVLGSAKTVFK